MTLGEIIPKTPKNYDEYHERVCGKAADLLGTYRIYNTQWVFIEDDVFGSECDTFKFVVHGSKIDRKSYTEIYRLIRSKGAVMNTIGRILEYQRYCDRLTMYPLVPEVTLVPDITEEKTYELEEDPQKEFIPSPTLIDKVNKSLVPLDKDMYAMLENLKTLQDNKVDEHIILSGIITEEVEDLFTDLARRMFRSKKQIHILEGKSFTHEICMDLTDRLGLHFQYSMPVLELLHDELIDFLLPIDRERDWGKITIKDSDIKLVLKEDAFSR